MNYPLNLSFKIAAFAPQVFVTDASGQSICYIKQKLFKLKEKVEVYTDSSKSNIQATIEANKIIDWSARYNFTTPEGDAIGAVGRKGMRSMWRAHYEVFNPGDEVSDFNIQEENPWSKVADSVLSGIPIIGLLAGYCFHPRYIATRSDGTPAMRLTKQPAFWEGKYSIEKLTDLTPQEELNLILSYLMLVLLERRRG